MPERGLCSMLGTGVPQRHILVMCCRERQEAEHWDSSARTQSIGQVEGTKARDHDAVSSRCQLRMPVTREQHVQKLNLD